MTTVEVAIQERRVPALVDGGPRRYPPAVRCPESTGTGVRIPSESMSGFDRTTQIWIYAAQSIRSRSSYPPIDPDVGEFAELSRVRGSTTRELEKSLRSLSDDPGEAVRAGQHPEPKRTGSSVYSEINPRPI